MKNFRLIRRNVDTNIIFKEIDKAIEKKYVSSDFNFSKRAPGLSFYKSQYPDYIDHHEQSGWAHLVVSFGTYNAQIQQSSAMNSKFLYKTPLYKHFPNTIKYLKQFAKENNCELQRVIFASLLPEGKVLPHVDRGEYFKYRDRYHLVLKSKGSEFSSGNEKQIFQEGEMWWFANKELHSVKNLDNSERLHIIFDLLPKNHYTLKQKIVKYFFNYFFQKYFDTYGKNEFTYFLENNPTLIKVLLSK